MGKGAEVKGGVNMYDALNIAKYVIDKCFKEGKPVTNLRLQKLLYFIQGYSYCCKNKEMFEEDMQAWQYGPVVPEVYFAYNGYSGAPIRREYNDIAICDNDKNIIDRVISVLEKYKDWELVDATHEKDSPWDKHQNKFSVVIPKEEIKNYFIANWNK